jgi:DNA-binding CsgD family transcriptional regulator/tetratricopeptide (TPR) repeat protein
MSSVEHRSHRSSVVGGDGALIGRAAELDALGGLLADARRERGRALVIRGEAGVGKTALLDALAQRADGFEVLQVAGVESEMELPYAALHQLCRPLLGGIEHLPVPQRAALEVAFGVSAGRPPEEPLVALAVLSLLSAHAGDAPLLCVSDDAQWLDRASARVLAFVARRLLADPVVMVFATRELTPGSTGLPELHLEGLDRDAAEALLGARVDERVRDRVLAEARGNPLALLELARAASASALAPRNGVALSLPVSSRLEERFAQQLEALPAPTRRLLLVAALEPVGEPARLWTAARHLGIAPEAARPAVIAGLLDIGEKVRFRHPLVRSAAISTAAPYERREAHRAIGAATDAELEPDRRAWHLAHAAIQPDEGLAGDLEQASGRAHLRGGLSAAAALLEFAAELTPDAERQARRRLVAAGTRLLAGDNERAQALLAQSAPRLQDAPTRAAALRMDGAIRFADGRGGETPALLFQAAMALRDADPGLARATLMESMEAAMWAGRLTSATTTHDVALAAAPIAPPDGGDAAAGVLLTGYTKRFTEGYPAAVPWWRRAFEAFDAELEAAPHLLWHGMMWNAAGEILDSHAHAAIARRWSRMARDQGALATLPVALSGLGWYETMAGRIDLAESLLSESQEISAATGGPAVPGGNEILRLGILSWRGADEARPLSDGIIAEATARGQGLGVTIAHFARTILELGHGRYEDARTAALTVFEEDPLYFGTINLADVVEATIRSGDRAGAKAALARLAQRAEATATPWGLGLLARARALVADDGAADLHYRRSIAHLARSGLASEQARTRLLYGEWLRRRRRRRDARTQLRVAHEQLQAIGADAFARRAHDELLATGEQARARVTDTREQLTPRERQIVLLAAEGETNAAIAAQLFISPHTVSHHLRKAFGKLGVSSRRQLAAELGDATSAARRTASSGRPDSP